MQAARQGGRKHSFHFPEWMARELEAVGRGNLLDGLAIEQGIGSTQDVMAADDLLESLL